MKTEVKVHLKKETKRTVLYEIDDAESGFTNMIYINKSALPQPFPATVTVSLEVEE
jgi:hypothetical protein